MAKLRSFFGFWYDFLVGDDWRVALGVVVALALTVAAAHVTDLPAWWIVALAVLVLLPMTIRRAARKASSPGE